jgi:hypothetical protein
LKIEQYPPNKPNFPLVVALFGVTLLLILGLAYFFIDVEGGHIHFRHRHANAHAQGLAGSIRLAVGKEDIHFRQIPVSSDDARRFVPASYAV